MSKNRTERALLDKIVTTELSGVLGVALIYPMDLAKTRLQYQTRLQDYSSTWDCLKKVRAQEGFRALYRGCLTGILFIPPGKILKLYALENLKAKFATKDQVLGHRKRLLAYLLASGFQSVVTCPVEVVIIQLQMIGKSFGHEKCSMNLLKCTGQILKNKGFTGLYRGLSLTILRDITFTLFYVPWFYALKSWGPVDQFGRGQYWWASLSAHLAASVGVLASHPFDVFQTRVQEILFKTGVQNKHYANFGQVVIGTFRTEGLYGCFSKGLGPRLVMVLGLLGCAQFVNQATPNVQKLLT